MAQYGPSLQTAEIATGNMRTTVDLYVPPGGSLSYLKNGARNALGQAYYDNTKTKQNPDGTWGKFRYVRYQSVANAAVRPGPAVVYWADVNYTTVTSSYTESVTGGLNSVAGVMMPNSLDMPLLTAATLNGNFVWICVGGVVNGAIVPALTAADDALIGSTTAWTPGRIASGTAPTNKKLATALGAISGGVASILVEVEG